VYVYVPNFVLIGLFGRPQAVKHPNFAVFGLQRLVVSPFGGNLRKLNTGVQLQTFSYPTASTLFLYSNLNNRRFALCAMLPVKHNNNSDNGLQSCYQYLHHCQQPEITVVKSAYITKKFSD